ncbi:MAG: hypothetical protein EBV06_05225 [Planctomycetia bacterium]|nr:hypothetical protein [Planctomycetia bacterium]
MAAFLQYHNAEKLGWVPFGERPFIERELAITTRIRAVQKAVSGTVYLIVKLPRPTGYYLWECFTVHSVEEREGAFQAWGPGYQLVPPQPLTGPEFEEFHRRCAYFVGFQSIDRHPFAATLHRLAQDHRADDVTADAVAFCSRLVASFPDNGDVLYYRAFVYSRVGEALRAQLDAHQALRLGTEYHEAALALTKNGFVKPVGGYQPESVRS